MLQKKDQVLCVPYDLIFSDDDGQKYVLLAVDRNDGTGMSTAVRCNVETGEESDYYTEIVGGDLKPGDKIVADTTIQEGDMFFPGSYWDMMEEAE
jgi:hypothetical protein